MVVWSEWGCVQLAAIDRTYFRLYFFICVLLAVSSGPSIGGVQGTWQVLHVVLRVFLGNVSGFLFVVVLVAEAFNISMMMHTTLPDGSQLHRLEHTLILVSNLASVKQGLTPSTSGS